MKKDVKKAAANDVDLEQIADVNETKEIDNSQLIADLTKKIGDLKNQLTDAKDELKKLIGKKSAEAKVPGVISTIITLVSDAPTTGISKAEILEKLVAAFPDRSADAMSKTVSVQLPNRASRERGIKIEKLENGNFHVVK